MESIARTGSTLEALKSICQQAGATFLGAGAIIHNRLHGKTWEGDLETLAQVGSVGWGWDGERQLLKRKKKTKMMRKNPLWWWVEYHLELIAIYLYHFLHELRCLHLLMAQAVLWISVPRWMIWPCRRWWQQMFSPNAWWTKVRCCQGICSRFTPSSTTRWGIRCCGAQGPRDQDRRLSTLNRNWCLQTGELLQRLGFEGNEIPAVALVLPIVALNRWIPAWWTCVGNCWLVSLLALAFRRFWRHRLEVYPQHMQSLGGTFILSSNFLIASFTFRTKTFRSVEAAWNCPNHICTVLSIPTS